HVLASPTLALILPASRSYPSPLTDILPTSQVGPAARGPQKSLNAGAEPASTAVTEPNRSQSPRCPCKVPPNFTIPWSGSSPGGWLPSICRFGGRLVQKRWRKWGSWRRPQVNQMVARAWSAATSKRFEVTAAIFSPPGCGGAYPTTADHRRPCIGSAIEPFAGERD